MMRRSALIVALLAVPGVAAAQSSQFGVRGLGLPVRPLSPRATATGGAFGNFDFESSLNPASVGGTIQFTALFTSAQNFRSSSNPFGSSSGKDNRFPQIFVGGPVGGTKLAVAVSLSGYTDRNFSLGTTDTIDLRGVPVGVFDTLSSRGGLSDLRAAAAWKPNSWLQVGLGLHAITGSNRLLNSRVFADSSYATAVERSNLSYLGLGMSLGALVRPIPRLTLSGSFRSDGHVNVERDTTKIASTDLPTSIGVGAMWQPSLRSSVAVSYQRTSWSGADDDIKAQGGIGAENAYQISAGLELLKDPRRPGHKPLRLGGSYATLPFPLRAGIQPREYGVSLGTGLRFGAGRGDGGFDIAIQQLWRSDKQGFTERATIVTLGVSLRP